MLIYVSFPSNSPSDKEINNKRRNKAAEQFRFELLTQSNNKLFTLVISDTTYVKRKLQSRSLPHHEFNFHFFSQRIVHVWELTA